MVESSMIVKYWGVRGSIPVSVLDIQRKELLLLERIIKEGGMEKVFGANPTPERIKEYLDSLPRAIGGTYGGDTTCIEIQVKNSPLMIIDAGSGIRDLGNYLMSRLFADKNLNPLDTNSRRKREIHLLLTHYHWDHIQGFPFFTPAFISGDKKITVNFYGKKNGKTRLSHVLHGQQEYPNFPIEWEAIPCTKSYTELRRLSSDEETQLGAAGVNYAELDHPDRVLGYSVSAHGKKFVCATDTEHRAVPDPVLVSLAKNADILYYDGQYTPEEYAGAKGMPKVRWGHSTYEWGIKTALAAGVRALVLGHHEPTRDDFGLDELQQRASLYKNEQLSLPEHKGKELEVIIAYQRMEQRL